MFSERAIVLSARGPRERFPPPQSSPGGGGGQATGGLLRVVVGVSLGGHEVGASEAGAGAGGKGVALLADAVEEGVDDPVAGWDAAGVLASGEVSEESRGIGECDAFGSGGGDEGVDFGRKDAVGDGLAPSVDESVGQGGQDELGALASKEAFEGAKTMFHGRES